jgi:rod shape-determining protein MreC
VQRGIARREIVAVAALGLSVLALVVPAVWVSKARMAARSAAVPVMRAGASERPRTWDDPAPSSPSDEIRLLRDDIILRDDQIHRLERELAAAVRSREQAASSRVDLGRFIEAYIVGRSVNWQERSFLIDRGRDDGVVLRAGCLEGGAVVGVVVETGPHVARVACLSEPGVRVAARTLETRRTGLVIGTGEGCELRYVSRSADDGERPGKGEFVVTSGRLGFFPPGFVVGWITSIGETADSLHLNIAVRPEVKDPPDGRVWVLKPTPREVDE